TSTESSAETRSSSCNVDGGVDVYVAVAPGLPRRPGRSPHGCGTGRNALALRPRRTAQRAHTVLRPARVRVAAELLVAARQPARRLPARRAVRVEVAPERVRALEQRQRLRVLALGDAHARLAEPGLGTHRRVRALLAGRDP